MFAANSSISVRILIVSALLSGTGLCNTILSYTVHAWSSPDLPPCPPITTAVSYCTIAQVGAFSDSLTLTPGVPETAVLFPLLISAPVVPGYPFQGAGSTLFPTIDFNVEDTVSGLGRSYQAEVPISYLVLASQGVEVYNFIAPFHNGYGPFSVEIDVPLENLGAVVIGKTVSYDLTATFIAPAPAPEPGTAGSAAIALLLATSFGIVRRHPSPRSGGAGQYHRGKRDRRIHL